MQEKKCAKNITTPTNRSILKKGPERDTENFFLDFFFRSNLDRRAKRNSFSNRIWRNRRTPRTSLTALFPPPPRRTPVTILSIGINMDNSILGIITYLKTMR